MHLIKFIVYMLGSFSNDKDDETITKAFQD